MTLKSVLAKSYNNNTIGIIKKNYKSKLEKSNLAKRSNIYNKAIITLLEKLN